MNKNDFLKFINNSNHDVRTINKYVLPKSIFREIPLEDWDSKIKLIDNSYEISDLFIKDKNVGLWQTLKVDTVTFKHKYWKALQLEISVSRNRNLSKPLAKRRKRFQIVQELKLEKIHKARKKFNKKMLIERFGKRKFYKKIREKFEKFWEKKTKIFTKKPMKRNRFNFIPNKNSKNFIKIVVKSIKNAKLRQRSLFAEKVKKLIRSIKNEATEKKLPKTNIKKLKNAIKKAIK
jgi:hypothetical protein